VGVCVDQLTSAGCPVHGGYSGAPQEISLSTAPGGPARLVSAKSRREKSREVGEKS